MHVVFVIVVCLVQAAWMSLVAATPAKHQTMTDNRQAMMMAVLMVLAMRSIVVIVVCPYAARCAKGIVRASFDLETANSRRLNVAASKLLLRCDHDAECHHFEKSFQLSNE